MKENENKFPKLRAESGVRLAQQIHSMKSIQRKYYQLCDSAPYFGAIKNKQNSENYLPLSNVTSCWISQVKLHKKKIIEKDILCFYYFKPVKNWES